MEQEDNWWMRNPILRGHTKHGDLLIKNTHEPIISEDEHSKMLDIIDKRTHKSKTKHNSIFRGVIECPQCQNKLYLVSSIQNVLMEDLMKLDVILVQHVIKQRS